MLGLYLRCEGDNVWCSMEVQLRAWDGGPEKSQQTYISSDRHLTRSQPVRSRLVHQLYFTVGLCLQFLNVHCSLIFFIVLCVYSKFTIFNSVELPLLITEWRDGMGHSVNSDHGSSKECQYTCLRLMRSNIFVCVYMCLQCRINHQANKARALGSAKNPGHTNIK